MIIAVADNKRGNSLVVECSVVVLGPFFFVVVFEAVVLAVVVLLVVLSVDVDLLLVDCVVIVGIRELVVIVPVGNVRY